MRSLTMRSLLIASISLFVTLVGAVAAKAGHYSAPVYSGGSATGNGSGTHDYASRDGGWGNSAGGGGESKLEGAITVTFTWVPTDANDTPPEKVYIQETSDIQSTATGFGASASSDTGLGKTGTAVFTPTPGLPGFGQSNAAIKYSRIKPYQGGQTVTFTCTPTATGNGTAGSAVSITYTASISTVKILRDNSDIVGANAKCLPGEQITLSISGPNIGSTYTWAEPDNGAFKNYNINASDGQQLESLSSVPRNQSTFTYRYMYGDSAKHKVSCVVQVNGQNTTIEDELNIIKPQSQMIPSRGGIIKFDPNSMTPSRVGYYGDYSVLGGMNWDSKVWITDSEVGSGHQFCHVQLINNMRFVQLDVVNIPDNLNGITTLDGGSFIYGDTGTVGTSNSMPALHDDDSPDFHGLQGQIANRTTALFLTGNGPNSVAPETFVDYLMFKSVSHGGCWVPLRKFNWLWQMKASYDNEAWTLSDVAYPDPSASQEIQFPPVW